MCKDASFRFCLLHLDCFFILGEWIMQERRFKQEILCIKAPLVLLFLGLWVLFVLNNVSLAEQESGQSEYIESRIVGGEEAVPGDWPWMAALVYRGMDSYWGQFCGGTLIAPEWVVTAAHCTEGSDASEIDVVVGRHNLTNRDGERIEVDLIIQHRNYDPTTTDSDISLLHLVSPTNQEVISGIVPAFDTERLTVPFTEATIIGWGDTTGFGNYTDVLMQATVQILPPLFGRRAYGNDFTINMLAAGYGRGGKDTCSGDSGGPLVVLNAAGTDWVLAGITSWGIGCALPGLPGVYTKVERFASWIDLILQRQQLLDRQIQQ